MLLVYNAMSITVSTILHEGDPLPPLSHGGEPTPCKEVDATLDIRMYT